MKAHLLCSRRRMLTVIALIWPTVCLLGLPIALYNQLLPKIETPNPDKSQQSNAVAIQQYCRLRFPGNHAMYFVTFKYMEFALFYLIPMVLQIVCYSVIGKHLFAGSKELHRRRVVWGGDNGGQKDAVSEALKARKGVVKMLMASVLIYFISYSPHQILLFYNTFSHAPFHQTWFFLVLVTAMGYVNSAANPILYCIFSQKFRLKFRSIICCGGRQRPQPSEQPAQSLITHYASNNTDSGVRTLAMDCM